MNLDFFKKNIGKTVNVNFKDGSTSNIAVYNVVGNDIIYVKNEILISINSKPINEQHEIIKNKNSHAKFNIKDVI